MRRFGKCDELMATNVSVPVKPMGMYETAMTSKKSQALHDNQIYKYTQEIPKGYNVVAYDNNIRLQYQIKQPKISSIDDFEQQFVDRIGNELFLDFQSGEISEGEFFREVTKERQRLRFERGESPTDSEYLLTTETESESETPPPPPPPQSKKGRGGSRPTAGRMTREEKAYQQLMKAQGIEAKSKSDVQVEMTLQDLLEDVEEEEY